MDGLDKAFMPIAYQGAIKWEQQVMEAVIKKWSPIMQTVGFNEEFIPLACRYAEQIAKREMKGFVVSSNPAPSKTYLPQALNILRKLQDSGYNANNIRLTENTSEVEVHQAIDGLKLSVTDVFELSSGVGREDVQQMVESNLTETIANNIINETTAVHDSKGEATLVLVDLLKSIELVKQEDIRKYEVAALSFYKIV